MKYSRYILDQRELQIEFLYFYDLILDATSSSEYFDTIYVFFF